MAVKDLIDNPDLTTDDIVGIKIGLMSPDRVHELSYGEVTSAETIDYKSGKPVRGGLFCQRIFGPVRNYECACGKCNSMTMAGRVCDFCGVEVTLSDVRRHRMGHIELAAPVAHIWYVRATTCRMAILLGIRSSDLKSVLGYSAYIVTDPGVDTDLVKYQILTEKEYILEREKYDDDFAAEKGAEPIRQLLEELDLPVLEKELIQAIQDTNAQDKKKRYTQRLALVRQFIRSGNRPEWMILTALPVLPPDLRPMSQLPSGKFAVSDINELYRRVILRNNRLRDMIQAGAPSLILDNEKRMLQDAVDSLLDNDRVQQNKQVRGQDKRVLKSLAASIGKKQGRFRRNLLGKRVDYSGRSVIVVGPELKMYECGLPKDLALELFKPFICKYLCDRDTKLSVKAAKHMVDRKEPKVYDALEQVIDGHLVFLNRAPTLHRLGIQAFQPVLVEGNAIKLHPLVCTAFNADFDGDQMGVHLPLSAEAQAEARFLMLSVNNLLKPSDGTPVVVPSQDMVLGAYYLTMKEEAETQKGSGKVFRDEDEAEMAYSMGIISLHAPIKVRHTVGEHSAVVETTMGRIIFNKGIPQELGYVDRTDPEHWCDYEVDFLVKKGELGKIVEHCVLKYDTDVASELLDHIKSTGYKYATKAGFTVSVDDAVIPARKAEIVAETEARLATINEKYRRGFMTSDDKSKATIALWNSATDEVTKEVEKSFDTIRNPIHIMADSGARGSIAQLRQLVGMRGLIANTAGKTIELPIKSNYREGLSGLEYYIAARGARKGFVDTAMRTADSGYLTRRLVTIAQDVVVTEDDCGCHTGMEVHKLVSPSGEIIETFEERIRGRYLAEPVVKDGVVIWGTDKIVDHEAAKKIANAVDSCKVRTVLACEAKNGVCCHCYGTHLATNHQICIGDAIGVISAQSIGEPGTQLTMRTFHTGGIASAEDITQGLPRVEEIFENRVPKGCGTVSHTDGVVEVTDKAIIVRSDPESKKGVKYPKAYGAPVMVQTGDVVKRGDVLIQGVLQPATVLEVYGVDALREYMITEVQKVYRQQGVDINDKHIEVIVRQMMTKVMITDAGDTKLAVGALYTKTGVDELNKTVQNPAKYKYTILGLTKMSTGADSFLSAASFQESTKVLTEAAIGGKVDRLVGLNENVLMGKLIPAGTGMPCYQRTEIISAEEQVKDFITPEELAEMTAQT